MFKSLAAAALVLAFTSVSAMSAAPEEPIGCERYGTKAERDTCRRVVKELAPKLRMGKPMQLPAKGK